MSNGQENGDRVERKVRTMLDPSSADDAINRIRDRHPVEVLNPERGAPRVAVDRLGRTERQDLLIIPGEIIVRDGDDAERASEILGQAFERRRPDCDLPIVRFVGAVPAAELLEAIRGLWREGIDASVNHILPFGMRAKGNVTPDQIGGITTSPPNPSVGKGAHVVVIDTGIIDPSQRTDGWLDGINPDPTAIDPLSTINEEQGKGSFLDDAAGHGTFVTGVIRQVAPGAKVTVIRALDSDGIGSEAAVACAILAAGNLEPDVINLSLGQESLDDREPVALAAALARVPATTVVVAAAGNSPDRIPTWPAAFPRVVAVGGLTAGLQPTAWSKRGPWVQVSTAGEDIRSTYVQGQESGQQDHPPDTWPATDKDPYAVWLGTSFAAPQIAGAIARDRAAAGGDAWKALYTLLASGTFEPNWGMKVRVL